MKIIQPTLLLDEGKCRLNIQRMAEKAIRNKLIFRPHFKTHQSQEIGHWFREVGVDKITVSSLKMARYFASAGWKDITVAFPTNILEVDAINTLAADIQLNLLVESMETIQFLQKHLSHSIAVFLKIDTGYHRTGMAANNIPLIDIFLKEIEAASKMTFSGFLAHSGHSYNAININEIEAIHTNCLEQLSVLRSHYGAAYPHLVISVGDTPTCSCMEDFQGADEIRPGNFVFYDLVQNEIGACNLEEIAVAMACPIVAIHEARNEMIIYGGGVHFSKDALTDENGEKYYGKIVENNTSGWGSTVKNIILKRISQEHGTIQATPTFIKKHKIGDIIKILPVHSCMTANLMKQYLTTDNKKISRC